MHDFPRVRWLALLLVIAFGVVLIGRGFDVAAALGSLGLKASAIGSLLLAVAKIVEEAMRPAPPVDPMVYTQGRAVDQPGSFWGRVL